MMRLIRVPLVLVSLLVAHLAGGLFTNGNKRASYVVLSVAILVAAFAVGGCAAEVTQEPVSDAGKECSCADELAPITVANCTPDEASDTCVDAGTHEGTLSDVATFLCPTTPLTTCAAGIYSVTCQGNTTLFRIVQAAGQCRLVDGPTP